MANLLSFGLNILADAFYPKYCFGCRRASGYLCKFCINKVPALSKSFCIICNKQNSQGLTHRSCKNKFTPDRLISAMPYQNETVSDMIITGKYYFIPEVFNVLGALTANIILENHLNIPNEDLNGFVICPIPLHKQKQKWRGFNQVDVAGKIIAQAFNLPYIPLLTRNKNTKTQKDLNAQQRASNVQNAFSCEYQPPKKVIIIDDVTTTGKTFIEAAQTLKQNGADTVWCISIAKD